MRETMNKHNEFERRVTELEEQIARDAPPTLDGKHSKIGKLKFQSKNFYEHVDFLYSTLRRFDSTDVPLLVQPPSGKGSR